MRPIDRYDAVLFDLDGVLYRGDRAIPGAAETIRAIRDAGRRVVFLTNNSSRPPEAVAERLSGMDIAARAEDVVTSAMATVTMLDGVRTAFVVGEEGVRRVLAEEGIEVLDGDPERADAVVVGWDRGANYDALRRASVLIQRGARLFATNTDASYPAPGGELWPGAGALVAAVETATGRRAAVGGKPERPLFDAAVARAGVDASRALMVGDRVETDVVGAAGAGIAACLVFTGASTPADLLDHDAQPVLAMDDVRDLLRPRPAVRVDPAGERAEEVRALVAAAGLPAEGPSQEAVAAVADDRVIATASASVRDRSAFLHSVAVDAELRGLHLGTLVVAAAVRRAVTEGASECVLVTEDAGGFFARLGFEEMPRSGLLGWMTERSGACSGSAAAMRRSIG